MRNVVVNTSIYDGVNLVGMWLKKKKDLYVNILGFRALKKKDLYVNLVNWTIESSPWTAWMWIF